MVTDTAIPDGYQLTEVGVVPSDWEVKDIEQLCVSGGLVRGPFGGSLKKEFFVKSGKKVYEQKNAIYRDEKIGTYYIDNSKFNELKRFEVKEGDFIVSCSGTIGRIFQIPRNSEEGIINQALLKMKTDESVVHDQYFYHYFDWEKFQNRIIDSTQGGAMKNLVGMSVFKTTRIALPPTKTEQTAIATALTDVDALIGSLEKLIAKKRNIKQGAMQELLTGKKRLPGFSGEWKVKKLGDIGEIAGAGVDKKIRPDEVPVRLVNYLDVFHRDFIYSRELDHWVTAPPAQAQRCAVQKGDIFFTPSSEMRFDIAISAVAMENIPDAAYSYHVVRLRLFEDWNLAFRTYIFKTRRFLGQAETICEGSGKRYVISLSKFRQMTVFYPPQKEEQKAIAQILADMDAEIERLEQKRDKYQMIKQGMMQELLTGRIRLNRDLKD